MRGLILGYGPRMVAACSRLGIEATVAAPQRYWAELPGGPPPGVTFLPVVNYEVEEVLGAVARSGVTPTAFDFVMAAVEFAMTPAATLAAALHVDGMPLPLALAVRDKVLQKQLIRQAGIPCADSLPFEADPASRPGPEASDPLLPGVLKPVSGAGSRDTVVVHDQQELHDVLEEIEHGEPVAHVLESFVEGEELHIDGVVDDGALWLVSVSRYRTKPIDVTADRGVSSVLLDPARHPDLYDRATALASASTATLGLLNGVFHLEAFDTGAGELVFSELAARVGGAYVVETVVIKFHVDLQEMRLRTELGLPLPARSEPMPRDIGWILLHLPPGTLIDVPSSEQLQDRPGVLEAIVEVEPGDFIGNLTTTSVSRAALAVVVADDEDELARRMDPLQEWLERTSTVVPAVEPDAAAERGRGAGVTPTLLLLGADRRISGAAADLGIRTVRCYGPWEKDYVLRADVPDASDVFVEDPSRADLVLAALDRAGLGGLCVDGVCVSSDAYIGAAGMLRALLRRSDDPRRADATQWIAHKDKAVQKRTLAAAEVEVAAHAVVDDVWEPGALDGWTRFPAVLKPLAEQGSVGVRRVEDAAGLITAVAAVRAAGSHRSMMIEQFVPGVELHVDGVVSGGGVEFVSVGVYDVTCLASAGGAVLSARIADPDREPELYRRVFDLCVTVLPVLGLADGVFHLEAFDRPGAGLLFSECAARLGGAGIPDAVERKFGVDLRRVYVCTEVGLPPEVAVAARPEEVTWVVLPLVGGSLLEVPSVADLRTLPGVVSADIRRPVGLETGATKVSSTYGLGTAVVEAPDAATVAARTDALVRYAGSRVRVDPPTGDVTPAFLRWRAAAHAG